MPDLTSIDKIDRFKNVLNKGIFMWLKLNSQIKSSQIPINTGKSDGF